jgi:hypothetical protein
MEIQVRTTDAAIATSLRVGTPPAGVTIVVASTEGARPVITGHEINLLVLSSLASVPASLLANWLWDKLKHTDTRATSLHVEHGPTLLSHAAIYEALTRGSDRRASTPASAGEAPPPEGEHT